MDPSHPGPPSPSASLAAPAEPVQLPDVPEQVLANSSMLGHLHSSANSVLNLPSAHPPIPPLEPTAPTMAQAANTAEASQPRTADRTFRIRLVPHISRTRPPVVFDAIERDLRPPAPGHPAPVVQIGRFTDRSGVAGRLFSHLPTAVMHPRPGARGGTIPSASGTPGWIDTERISFMSKVVSRNHAHLWCDASGNFYLRDVGSSSGTFINHTRLSEPGQPSPPIQVHDGDCIQLGVDYQSRTEQNFRAVLMRVELNRGWQQGPNQFNTAALRQLRRLQGGAAPHPDLSTESADADHTRETQHDPDQSYSGSKADPAAAPTTATHDPSQASSHAQENGNGESECCICLFNVSVCQSLFIAPCSHAFHYKCIRPLLVRTHPAFTCPMCRTYADLEADVENEREAAELDAAFAAAAANQVSSGLSPRVAPAPAPAPIPRGDHQAEIERLPERPDRIDLRSSSPIALSTVPFVEPSELNGAPVSGSEVPNSVPEMQSRERRPYSREAENDATGEGEGETQRTVPSPIEYDDAQPQQDEQQGAAATREPRSPRPESADAAHQPEVADLTEEIDGAEQAEERGEEEQEVEQVAENAAVPLTQPIPPVANPTTSHTESTDSHIPGSTSFILPQTASNSYEVIRDAVPSGEHRSRKRPSPDSDRTDEGARQRRRTVAPSSSPAQAEGSSAQE